MVSRDLNRLRIRRSNIHYEKDFTVNVESQGWERKFVWNLVGIVCFVQVDKKHATASYKSLLRPILVNTAEVKLSMI